MNWSNITTDGELIGGQLRWRHPLMTGETEFVGSVVVIRVPPRSNKVRFVFGWVAKRSSPEALWEIDQDVPSMRLYRPVDCSEPVYRRGVWAFQRMDEEVRLYDRESRELVRPRQVRGLSQCLLVVPCPDAAYANALAETLAGQQVLVYDRFSGAMSTHE